MLINHPWFERFLHPQEKQLLDIHLFWVFFLVFLFFSTIYQISRRREDITPDTLDEVSRKQIKGVIFWENVWLGLLSWGSGILLGLAASPLIFRFFASMMETPIFPFIFPFSAIWKSALFFIPAFLLSGLIFYFFLYPRKKGNLHKKWQFSIRLISSSMLLLFLYGYLSFFGSIHFQQVPLFFVLLGVFFVAAVVLLYFLDKKIGIGSVFSKQQFLGGLTGKILVIFLGVLFLFSAITDMKIFLTSYLTQKNYYQENAFTFYLEAIYQDKSKLSIYQTALEQELKKQNVNFYKQVADFLIVHESEGARSPLVISASQYANVAKLMGKPNPQKLKENEGIYFFTTVNSYYQKQSDTDKHSIAFEGYPTAFYLHSNVGSFIPGYDVMVVADDVYQEIASIRTSKFNYSIPDRYVFYMVPSWMKESPNYDSPELRIGSKWINQIEGSPRFIPNQNYILNGYVGHNENYELTVRSPYGMGVNNIRFLFMSFAKGLIGWLMMLFLYERKNKFWWVSFYYPFGIALLASFLFSLDRSSFIALAIGIVTVWIHIFFFLISKEKITFHR
ncbi:ABC transporter permease [Shimazuella kribbensis]|uniref:ABC transporter permease n=1 Tax=Shimazuella kribbensis TaxID=139808 RepID=UPI00041BF115|nr:ABC transporter permease [Shimazuella kribbensis]